MKSLKIAFFPQQRLGDGAIALVLANNLKKNNYDVTMFHEFIHQINHLFEFDIKSCPKDDEMEKKLSSFDIVLMDCNVSYIQSKTEEEQKELAKKYVFFSVGKMKDIFFHDHTELLINKMGDGCQLLSESITLAHACRTIKYDKSDSMVDNIVKYSQQALNLKNCTNETGIKIPTHYQYRKFNKRIVISPTSSLEKKNWKSKKFILLARLLREKGYEPNFAVAMSEREEWKAIINNEFDLPKFETITKYSQFLYESLGFIGNDSGGGHIASMMGVPVLTIVTSPKKINFKWRPGWGNNAVVAPYFTFKFKGTRYWYHFLSVRKVFNQFKQLIEKTPVK